MQVIGTAGHVDHGKTTLVFALTGMNADRLKEEQDREMTIDLGFAWMPLANGETVGIIDVPGHRDFIENMLAGVGGIDAALLVIAADEGIMPQTREHLAILDLLQISSGIIVLTKIDLVPDTEWLLLVEADIKAAVHGSSMENAPIIRVSSKDGTGIEFLKGQIQELLSKSQSRPDLGKPRLPIDRIFSLTGFGTVVTGTLQDGEIQQGDEIEILPSRKRGRVRGLQSYNQKVLHAVPGSRVAVNISGINFEQIIRGNTLAKPDTYAITQRLDVRFRLLSDTTSPFTHNQEVKLFIATSEVIARVRIIGDNTIAPGEEGWLQLETTGPIVAARGDKFILRRPSPGETLGGGTIIDANPEHRVKRFEEKTLNKFRALSLTDPTAYSLEICEAQGITTLPALLAQLRVPEQIARELVLQLISRGDIVLLEGGDILVEREIPIVAKKYWTNLSEQVVAFLKDQHKNNPWRAGLPREQVKNGLRLEQHTFLSLIKKWIRDGLVIEHNALIALPDHVIRLSDSQKKAILRLHQVFNQNPYSPPPRKAIAEEVGEQTLQALIDMEELMVVSEDVIFRRKEYLLLIQRMQDLLQTSGKLTVSEFRDIFKTSRKYALAFLEHTDRLGMTQREGDFRIKGKRYTSNGKSSDMFETNPNG